MKKTCNFIIAICFISSMGLIFMNCAPTPDDGQIVLIDGEYVDSREIEKSHKVGGTSCPQNLGEITVSQNGVKGDLTPIDSAYFSCEHTAIDIYVNDVKGTSSCTFDNVTENKLTVEFNCGQTTDVDTEVTCSFFSNDTLKKTEKIKVKLSVN